MIEMLKKMVLTFFLTVVGIIFSTTVFLTIFYPEIHLYLGLLWQIIMMSFVCTLGNLIFYSKYEISKRQMMIRKTLHFLYINAIVIGGAFLWSWVTPGILTEFFTLLIMIELVYAVVMMINIWKEKKDAEAMNKRLSQLNSEDEKKENQEKID
jgi:amino acid transporter